MNAFTENTLAFSDSMWPALESSESEPILLAQEAYKKESKYTKLAVRARISSNFTESPSETIARLVSIVQEIFFL